MIEIRTINPDELAAFAGVCTRPEDVAAIRSYLDRLLSGGYTHIDWCYVVEQDGQMVGRVAYWSLPSSGVPSDIIVLDLPWAGDWRAVGQHLLTESAAIVRGRGTSNIDYVLDFPAQNPQWQHYPEQRDQLLTDVGFGKIRETLRFRRKASDPALPESGRLTYKPLPEVGNEAYIDAIGRVSVGSLDQRDREDSAAMGTLAYARHFFKDMQALDSDPAIWQLAYDGDALVGLVMPAATMSWATIGYIGVAPEQRGKGFIHDLLAKGTAILSARGVDIVCDTDVSNKPMQNAFRRAGYEQFATRREYRWRWEQ